MYPWMVSTRGSGPRVVLVHGNVANGSTWSAQAPLAESLELVIPDRGGYWPNPPRGETPFPQQAAEIAELIEPGTHLVGHSYGGILSMLAAATRVEDVASLTVLEPPLLDVARGVPIVDELIAHEIAFFADGPDDPREFMLGFLKMIGSDYVPPDPLPKPIRQGVEMLRIDPLPTHAKLPPELDPPPFRCLVVSGAHFAPHDAVCDVLTERLRAERAVLPGAGHMIQRLGAPFNELLLRFVTAG
jgi:pimeloyl-ACP methyl ester carboxylesterase